MTWEQWTAVIALVLAVFAAVAAGIGWQMMRRRQPDPAPAQPQLPHPFARPAVVFNPTKGVDGAQLKQLVTEIAADHGMGEPIWYETTQEDPGSGQTEAALARGAVVVIAAGGDGTVRAVAEAMAASRTPMGVLPLGTGNLFARNLDIPLASHREMITTALTGRNRRVDLGWLDVVEPAAAPMDDTGRHSTAGAPAERASHAFLVIGGVGFDAEMIGGTDDHLKARIGWVAYFVSAVRYLRGRKVRAQLEFTDGSPARRLTVRTVLVANCGRLPGGVVLLPDAVPDDGWLDIAAIDTRGGLIGWADLLRRVVMQGLGMRNGRLPYSTSKIDFHRTREVLIRTEYPEQVQVDGEALGSARAVAFRVQDGALLVRCR